jgi:hypothetical protein
MNMWLDELLAECLKKNFNLEKGDSGFSFQCGTRDITFHDDEGTEVEITYRIKHKVDQESEVS